MSGPGQAVLTSGRLIRAGYGEVAWIIDGIETHQDVVGKRIKVPGSTRYGHDDVDLSPGSELTAIIVSEDEKLLPYQWYLP